MQLEVELKFAISSRAGIRERLAALGALAAAPQEQQDVYFAHPARDFSQTDEALRIRRVGEANWVTYKGPKLDLSTKTRRELELPLSPGAAAADQLTELLSALGFRPVATVAKRRQPFKLAWQGRGVDVALDEVHGLGDYLELELISDTADLASARHCLESLAELLHLPSAASERRSYLELLLDRSPR